MSRDLLPEGKNYQHFWKSLTTIYYSDWHIQGATTKITQCCWRT